MVVRIIGLIMVIIGVVSFLTTDVETLETLEISEDIELPKKEKIIVSDEEYYNELLEYSFNDLKDEFYTVDDSAYFSEEDLNIKSVLEKDFSMELLGEDPKVLIFHTHTSEDFIDSVSNNNEDNIVAIGRELARSLSVKYGISVVHDVGQYDTHEPEKNSYEYMEEPVKALLKKYPTIEMTIDLHRDGVDDDIKFITEIDGKPTAKIMFFNGVSALNDDGEKVEMKEFYNPYKKESIQLALQMKLKANELYGEDLTRKIYVRPYRYSLHLKERSILVELGANTNTYEEALNAVEPLSEIIYEVIK